MNVLMIGAGDIARSHGRAVEKLDGKVIAAFDVNAAGLKRYREEFNCEPIGYDDLDSWIPKADYVVLCTPPTKRLDYVEKVLSAHVPLYMEKPVAVTLEDAQTLKEMEQKYDAKIIVGFAHRYRPAFQKLVELVRSGELGDPINVFDNRVGPGFGFRGSYFAASWRTDPKLACGFSMNGICSQRSVVSLKR